MMHRFRVYGYALCVVCYVLVPVLALAGLVFVSLGDSSLPWSLGFICCFLFGILTGGEVLLARLYGACALTVDVRSAFSAQSLERTLGSVLPAKQPLPRIRVIQHPMWVALPVRSLFRPGTILISQGLLAVLSERELLLLLSELASALKRPGSILQIFRWILLYPFRPTRGAVLSPGIGLYLLFLFPMGWALNEMKRAAGEPELCLMEREIVHRNTDELQTRRLEFYEI